MKKLKFYMILISAMLLTGCSFAVRTFAPTPTVDEFNPDLLEIEVTDEVSTIPPTPEPTATTVPVLTATPPPVIAVNICNDPMVTTMIDTFEKAILTSDGDLFASLASPDGIEVSYYRDGNGIRYTPDQAKFLFTTTYEANWGSDPASGLEKQGSFHDVVVPELVKVFNQPHTLHCNEIRTGGATYIPQWPYGRDFYSIHFAGTDGNGFLDWHTWVIGVEYVNGKPHLYALMQFYWEP